MEQKARHFEVVTGDRIIVFLKRNDVFAALSILTTLVGAYFCFPATYVFQTNVILGILMLPFVTFIAANERRNNYWLLAAIMAFGIIAFIFSIRIAYFFSLAFALLWLIEYCLGRGNALATFLVIFMSPVFSQVATIIGFPIRLKLSALAGGILHIVGIDAVVEGNTLILDNIAFSVDEACMGLSMLSLSMLIGTFLLAFQYRSIEKSLSPLQLVAFFTVALLLNIVTNLCRIVVLVLFRIPPEAVLHEVIGLLCFAFYTVVPLYFISAWLVKRGSSPMPVNVGYGGLTTTRKMYAIMVVLLVVSIGITVGNRRSRIDEKILKSEHSNGVLAIDGVKKISSHNLLIYVKLIPEWFTSEHTPLYCWRGSGYAFSAIREVEVAGRKIYSGRLVRNDESLFTAWWYSNGEKQTISQLAWRGDMLSGGANYYLVNVTTGSEKTLISEVERIFARGDHELMVADEKVVPGDEP